MSNKNLLDNKIDLLQSKKEAIHLLENKINNLNNVFIEIFTVKEHSFVPKVSTHKTHSSVSIDYFRSLKNVYVNSSLNFTLSVVNEELDFVSNISFFNNNSNCHDIENLFEYNKVYIPVLDLVEKLDINKVITLLIETKKYRKEINLLEKEIHSLKREIEIEKSQNQLNIIFNIFKPIKTFCIDSFLLKYFDIPFEGKPNRANLKSLNEAVLNFYEVNKNTYFSKKLEFLFIFISFENGKIYFKEEKLKVHSQKDKIIYYFDFKKRTKKYINSLLGYQFTYNDSAVIDSESFLKQFDLRTNTGYNFSEIKDRFEKETTKILINEF